MFRHHMSVTSFTFLAEVIYNNIFYSAADQLNNFRSTSRDVAIHDDGASSQNTSDIEFSLVSETSITDLHVSNRKTIASDPIVKLSHKSSVKGAGKHQPNDNYINCHGSRKSISAQNTPLFARHSKEGEHKKVITFMTDKPVSRKIPDEKKAESKNTIASLSGNSKTVTTTSTFVNLPAEHQIKKKHKLRDIAIEYEIEYEDTGQSPRGFISSFNQLTSNIPPAVITKTKGKTHHDSIKLKQLPGRSKVVSNQSVERTNSKKEKKSIDRDLEKASLEADDVVDGVGNKKKKRKSELEVELLYRSFKT